MAETTSAVSTQRGGTPSRSTIYAKLVPHIDEAIKALLENMSQTSNLPVRQSAVNTFLNKVIPDLKGVELTGENGEPIKLSVIAGNGYLPKLVQVTAPPEASTLGEQQEVQSLSVAQTSTEDDNRDNGDSKTSAN